ncbi:MAG: hypothetical protein OHK0057_36600 [Thermoflexibacter sp.]
MSIDRLFKNKLENHQVEPSDQAWKKLEEALYGKQIKQRSLVGYWRVAAAVALILTASFFYYQNEKEQNQGLADKNLNEVQEKNSAINKAEQVAILPDKSEKEMENADLKERSEKKQSVPKQDKIAKKVAQVAKLNNLEVNQLVQKNIHPAIDKNLDKGISEEVIAQNTTQKIEKEEVSSEVITSSEQEESFAIVVRVEEQYEEEKGIEVGKKSWFKKMVNNMRKNREKEREKYEEYEDRPEKPNVSIFGISADKIFAKKQQQSEQQKQNNE